MSAKSTSHRFGGAWTEEKLRVLDGYLRAYTTALRNTSFAKGYIDAFAGSGYRDAPEVASLFPDMADQESQDLLDGSARIALKVDPPFDGYIFIERHAGRRKQLERLRSEFPDRKDSIRIRGGDANVQIQEICRIPWQGRRAVLFLDPYGMQVEWKTFEAVASTRAIDMWLLFPLGIGVNRLLTRKGDIPETWRTRLNLLLGTDKWYEEFYNLQTRTNLFGDNETTVTRAGVETIGRYFNERLKSIFAAVAEEPLVLRNSRGSPLYLLCFAVGNESGAPIALRIARSQLSRGWR